MDELKTKTEGKPSAGIKKVATRVGALKSYMDYRLSVIYDAPTKNRLQHYITGFELVRNALHSAGTPATAYSQLAVHLGCY